MKLFISILFLSSLVSSAQASIFDLETDATEMANAMAHCPAEVAKLLPPNRNFYVKSVISRVTQSDDRVSKKGYDVRTQQGGGFQPVVKGQTLSIELTVTQPPKGMQDAPARQDWSCLLH
jgi:hypothetical protein